MFGLGAPEIIVILILALLVLGPNKLPEVGASIGKTLKDLRETTKELTDDIISPIKEVSQELKTDIINPLKADLIDPLQADVINPLKNDFTSLNIKKDIDAIKTEVIDPLKQSVDVKSLKDSIFSLENSSKDTEQTTPGVKVPEGLQPTAPFPQPIPEVPKEVVAAAEEAKAKKQAE